MSGARTAVLYDIHGNLPALQAVVDDAHDAGVDEFILGGDYVLFGAYPAETMELLDSLNATWIRGNTDRWVAGVENDDLPDNPLVQKSLAFCRSRLSKRQIESLGKLAPTVSPDDCLFCHASPRSDMLSFMPTPQDTDPDLLANVEQHTIVFGHTHLQFRRKTGAMQLINPGSVGLPFDGDRQAAYAIWDGAGEFDLRRVAYDTTDYVNVVKTQMGPPLGDQLGTLVGRLQKAAVAAG